jgi:hypothetical protein
MQDLYLLMAGCIGYKIALILHFLLFIHLIDESIDSWIILIL